MTVEDFEDGETFKLSTQICVCVRVMVIIRMDEQLAVQMGKGQPGVYCVHLINVQNLITSTKIFAYQWRILPSAIGTKSKCMLS